MDRRTPASRARRWCRGQGAREGARSSLEDHQLGRATALDKHDRVLPERPPDRFRLRARDPDHQSAALRSPAPLRIAPLAFETAVSRLRLRLDQGGVCDLVLPRARQLAARVGGGDERRGRRAFGFEQLVQVRIRLADADHELGPAEDDVERLFVGGDQLGRGGRHSALLPSPPLLRRGGAKRRGGSPLHYRFFPNFSSPLRPSAYPAPPAYPSLPANI